MRRGAAAARRCNGRPIRVSGLTDDPPGDDRGRLVVAPPPEPYIAMVDHAATRPAREVRRAGSGALGLAYVADGRTDGYCELHINSWDALAGLLLVEEAGGWTNDFLGRRRAAAAAMRCSAARPR